MENLRLPDDLEEKVLARFDQLASQEKIFYEESTPEIVRIDGFNFMFIIASILNKKPILSANDPSRSKAGGPFINPNPEEVIMELGSSHRLLVNKYGIFRPMTVIPTIRYASQNDDLDLEDINAVWSVLTAMKTPSLMIYNCGVNSGSSQGHKHMQVFPLPVEFGLWPEKAESLTDVAMELSNVPFKHFVIRLPKDPDAKTVYQAYLRLLDLAQQTLSKLGDGSRDYNVSMTAEWIAVIPRRTKEGPYGANTAAMLGIIYVPNQNERDRWVEVGYTKHLADLGIAIEAE